MLIACSIAKPATRVTAVNGAVHQIYARLATKLALKDALVIRNGQLRNEPKCPKIA
jgi:hypothetical protein